MNEVIPYSTQDIIQNDIDEVVSCIKSGSLTQGSTVTSFESKISELTSCPFACATSNASMGLLAACKALGVGAHSRVWCSSISFVSSANCALHLGANVDFVDIDANSFNICVNALAGKLQSARELNELPDVVIVVHLAGSPCDMASIYQLKEEYGFSLIEDASHALGASHNGISIGGNPKTEITIFSFHPVKIITTAEGGMLLTHNAEIAGNLRALISHGLCREIVVDDIRSEIWLYDQTALGYNMRMPDVNAALGIRQLERLDVNQDKRQNLADIYKYELMPHGINCQFVMDGCRSAYHLFIVRIEKELKQRLFFELRKKNIQVSLHYPPIYLHSYYKAVANYPRGYCPEAERYYSECLSLPLFPNLSEARQRIVIDAIKREL